MIIAGIDEAGYGPMLGPLVICASVFRVPENADASLWEQLAPLVARKPADGSIAVNDSKKIYKRRKGLQDLEEGLLPFVAARYGEAPGDLRSLLRQVARRGSPEPDAYLDRYPWYAEQNLKIPVDSFSGLIEKRSSQLSKKLKEAGIELLGLAAIPMEVVEFNQGISEYDNKSKVSFKAVGSLLKRIWKQFPDEPVDVMIDRQGGRTRYSRLLFSSVSPRGIQIDEQNQELSSYRLSRRNKDAPEFRVSFAKGSEEKNLCVALSSMLAKYLRELHMKVFNQYWRGYEEKLKPTAGYVLDARRFLEETVDLRSKLKTDPELLIRCR
jgi:ribonuclease HII